MPANVTPAPLTATHPFIVNIRRKLERWELAHLRQISLEQADKIELLECNLTRETDRADYWWGECMSMIESLQEDGREIGLSMAGEISVLPEAPQRTDGVVFHDIGSVGV